MTKRHRYISQGLQHDPNKPARQRWLARSAPKGLQVRGGATNEIHRAFEDIKAKKRLPEFHAANHVRRGAGGALFDAVTLQPEIGGIGFDEKKLFTGRKGG